MTKVQIVAREFKAREVKVTEVYLHHTGKVAVSLLRNQHFSFSLLNRVRDVVRPLCVSLSEAELTYGHLFLLELTSEGSK